MDNLSSSPLTLLLCSLCVSGCYISYAICQEGLYSYRSPIDGNRFEGTGFFLLCVCLSNTIMSLLILYLFGNKRTIRIGDLWKYAPSGFSYFGAMFFSNEALKYITYPTQAIIKACKIIPVTLFDVIVNERMYTVPESVAILIVALGLYFYLTPDLGLGLQGLGAINLHDLTYDTLKEQFFLDSIEYNIDQSSSNSCSNSNSCNNSSGIGLGNPLYGKVLLFLSLTLDGVTGALQDDLLSSYSSTSTSSPPDTPPITSLEGSVTIRQQTLTGKERDRDDESIGLSLSPTSNDSERSFSRSPNRKFLGFFNRNSSKKVSNQTTNNINNNNSNSNGSDISHDNENDNDDENEDSPFSINTSTIPHTSSSHTSISAHEWMLGQNLWALVFALALCTFPQSGSSVVVDMNSDTNSHTPGLCFLLLPENRQALSYLFVASLSAALGQVFVFYTLVHFSPIVLAGIGSLRKVLTLVISLHLYGHTPALHEYTGVVLVVCGLLLSRLAKVLGYS